MKAILPSAGYATRLYPLTEKTPKTLLKIGNNPIIEHIIKKIEAVPNIDEIIIITNNKYYNSFLSWKKQFISSKSIKILNDFTNSNEDRLGTIKDIQIVLEKENVKGNFLVINSDNFFSFNLNDIIKNFKKDSLGSIAMFDVVSLEIAKMMGSVKLDENKKLIFFKEKDENVESGFCSVGVYHFSEKVRELMNEYLKLGLNADKSGNFLEWLYKKGDIYGHTYERKKEFWFDIGSKESYEKAKSFFEFLY